MKRDASETAQRNAYATVAYTLTKGRHPGLTVSDGWETVTQDGTIVVGRFDDGDTLIGVQGPTGSFAAATLTPKDLAQHIEDCRQALALMQP